MSSTSSSSARICSGSSMGSFRILMKLNNTAVATIIVRDVCNFVRRVVERHGNSLFHTPNILSTVFRQRICATLYLRCGRFADQLLVSLDIGGMDTPLSPSNILWISARSNCALYATIVEYSGIMYCMLPGQRATMFKMSKFGPQTA
jgi:hypothetical protein